jgi:hypothetical protein
MKTEVMKYLDEGRLLRILKEERNFEVQGVVRDLTQSEAVELVQRWKGDASKIEGPPKPREG